MTQKECETVSNYVNELHKRVSKAISEIEHHNYGLAKETLMLFNMPQLILKVEGE